MREIVKDGKILIRETAMANGMPADKADMVTHVLSKTGYAYKYPTMAIRMLRRWLSDYVILRDVQRQHTGSWGPWYHWTKQVLNPITGCWIYVEEIGRCGHGYTHDSDCPLYGL